ncbi:hypothetical protein G5B30_16485 [Sphingobacterium sp. SGG-5]|uniref:hypothetical protein n=1 Tax=Sphingobacterium sp. SGG-5 TaxID=2710881 RepID=UPI0013ED5901|nr:hypothetical protein [Sphingobacterium sp. SGG-5]NGM63508.1 hypothetical protein [Sphingobacterium sp. SGG-5]
MGMDIGVYYNMLYPDLLLKIEGYQSRRKHEEYMWRKIGFSALTSGGLAPKGLTEEKYWPIDKDKTSGVPEFDNKKEAFKELLKQVQNKQIP